MALLTESEARAVLEKTLAFSKSDACEVTLVGARQGNIRFARNAVSTSGGSDALSLSVTSCFGTKSGSVTSNEIDDRSLERAVRSAEELARLSPDNPEFVPFVGKQEFLEPKSYFESTARLTQNQRVDHAAASIKLCRDQNLTAAGYLSDATRFSSIANSRGLYGYHRRTDIDFSVTTRTADERGSGYGIGDFNDASLLNTGALTAVAARKAAQSRDARAIEPGKYTVLLEPSAGVTLVNILLESMSARMTDEGRSFLSKAGGGSRLGERIVDERVHLYTDPLHPDLPGNKWASDGRPRRRVDWIQGGVVRNLGYTRYWARKKGLADDQAPPLAGISGGGLPVPGIGRNNPANFAGAIMAGSNTSFEDLVKQVKRGVLVTRLWYIRAVDPQTLLYTGLTRDGTFFIENGEIKFPVKNFRFNESPVIMLNNVEALGRPMRVENSLIPPMVLRDFTFSSLSDAV
jgi:predicted Zn-dependent protease